MVDNYLYRINPKAFIVLNAELVARYIYQLSGNYLK